MAGFSKSKLILQRGDPPQARYMFKHALIQDAAYHSLLRANRRIQHSRVAEAVEKLFPEMADTQPELLAHHYTEAGLSAEAIPFWRKAGQRAVERSANVEALNHINRGLALLRTLDDTTERAAEELTLQVTLGVPLGIIRGYASPEVRAAYERARDLCQQIGETRQSIRPVGALETSSCVGGIPSSERIGRTTSGARRTLPEPGLSAPSAPCPMDYFGPSR